MYREVIKLEAHSKKEALINLGHALKEVLGCKNDSHIFTRVLVPDENGDIEDDKPEIMISCEDPSTTYLCYRDMRFIFRDGEYAGWYKP